MLDIVRIRNNPKEIEDALRKRMDNISLDEVLMWDEEKRKIGTERDELKNQKNQRHPDNNALCKKRRIRQTLWLRTGHR